MAIGNSGHLIDRQVEAHIEAGNTKAEAARELATEKRLNTQAIDDLRMETRSALRAAGINVGAIEDHSANGAKP